MGSRGCLETKAHLENLESQVTWVFLESLALSDKLDHGESEVYPEREESWGLQACRDLKASLVHLVLMVQRVVLVLPGPLVTRDLQVCRGCQEREASLALPGPKVTEEPSVRKDQREQLEMTVQEEVQVLSAR